MKKKEKDQEREIIGHQITPGMVIFLQKNLYKVESVTKVTMARGTPFIKVKLTELSTGKSVEKNLKPAQAVKEVVLQEQSLEFLYVEDKAYHFLNIETLDQILVPEGVVKEIKNFLKEGVRVKASFYVDTVFNIELPQFLELMVSNVIVSGGNQESQGDRVAVLETGAEVQVPAFVDVGDIIKVDTQIQSFIQRV